MESEILQKVILFKQKVEAVREAPLLQKASRAELALQDAVYILEILARENAGLESRISKIELDGVSL